MVYKSKLKEYQQKEEDLLKMNEQLDLKRKTLQ